MVARDIESWTEFCRIGIIPEAYPAASGGGAEIQFAGLTEEISGIDFGDREVEGIVLANGGRIIKPSPMGDESITLKVYPVDVALDDESGTALAANGVAQLFHPQAAESATAPLVVSNSIYRRRFGIILLWSETLPAKAGSLPAADLATYRIQIVNAYMTAYKLNYDDKQLSAEITFKWAPFNKLAVGNKREESTSSTQLAAAITTATSF